MHYNTLKIKKDLRPHYIYTFDGDPKKSLESGADKREQKPKETKYAVDSNRLECQHILNSDGWFCSVRPESYIRAN